MTIERTAEPGAAIGYEASPGLWSRLMSGSVGPVVVVCIAIVVVWYLGAIALNYPFASETLARGGDYTTAQLVHETLNQERPVLPSPHQVAAEIWKTTVAVKPTSKRSLVYHGCITLSSTLTGFVFGTILGILLAVGIVHSRTLDMSLMPWIIASQTIPILAIAPMIVVVLASIGVTGLLPKAVISTYLSFFPVTVGMVKGLRSPDPMHLDLMRTYNASRAQVFWKLRWPSALPFLFTSMKVGIAASPRRRDRRRDADRRGRGARGAAAVGLLLRADRADLVGAAGRVADGRRSRRHRRDRAGDRAAAHGGTGMSGRPPLLPALAGLFALLAAVLLAVGWAPGAPVLVLAALILTGAAGIAIARPAATLAASGIAAHLGALALVMTLDERAGQRAPASGASRSPPG